MRTDNTPFDFSCCEFWCSLVCYQGSGFFMLPSCFLLQQMVSSTGGALSVCECDYCVSVMTVYSTFRRSLQTKAAQQGQQREELNGIGAGAWEPGRPSSVSSVHSRRGLSQAGRRAGPGRTDLPQQVRGCCQGAGPHELTPRPWLVLL